MPRLAKKEFELLDRWGRERHGAEWDKLTDRQKSLFHNDFFYLNWKKRLVHKNGGERR